jgi:hypothetical protein
VTQTFAVGTGGTDFNIASVGTTHIFNIPDASTIARGFVSTGAQTYAGSKSFANAPTFSSITAGSLLFAGTGGTVTQDNSNFFWDNTNKRLGIGTNTPNAKLEINSGVSGSGGIRFTQLNSTSTGIAANGKVLTVNGSGDIVLANMAYGADVIVSKTTVLPAAMSNTGQVVIFNSETQDINNGHNNTTGIYTTPTGGNDTYTIETQLGFTVANQLSRTPCVAIRRA